MKKAKQENIYFNRLHNKHRLIIAVLLAAITFFTIEKSGFSRITEIMITLDVFTFVLLTMSWITFFTMPQQDLRMQVKEQDGSRIVVFIVILIAALASMLSVGLLLFNDTQSPHGVRLAAAICGMFFSWMLVQTTFTFRYAHLYYADHKTTGQDIEGLEFPDDHKPDYLDFAYFSFVLGMTFQVSDVEISEKRLRRLALLHGMISFFYNTILIALTINILAGGK